MLDNLEILKDIISNCNYKDGSIDVHSIKTIRFFELLNSQKYKSIVDWNCK